MIRPTDVQRNEGRDTLLCFGAELSLSSSESRASSLHPSLNTDDGGSEEKQHLLSHQRGESMKYSTQSIQPVNIEK